MKKFTLFTIFLIGFGLHSQAQLAVINSQKVLASVPAFAKTDTLIAKETVGYTAEFNKKQGALNQLVKVADSLYKLDAKGANTTQAIVAAQVADKEVKAYADAANKKLADYKQLLQKPYIDKVMAAIKVVAMRRKLMQVIDSTNNLLYVNPLGDITEEVIKELKLK